VKQKSCQQTCYQCYQCSFVVKIQAAQRAKKELEDKKEALKKLKRQCQKQKQWLAEYQLLIRAGASGQHKVLDLPAIPPFFLPACLLSPSLLLSPFLVP